jgi:hypothetical protein
MLTFRPDTNKQYFKAGLTNNTVHLPVRIRIPFYIQTVLVNDADPKPLTLFWILIPVLKEFRKSEIKISKEDL